MTSERPLYVSSFCTDLGWIALVASEAAVEQIVFAHPSRAAALAALSPAVDARETEDHPWRGLVERLREYAAGRRVLFGDVPLALDHLTPFRRRVVKHCRAIAYGKTRSYGELAALAGHAHAARAVGSTMATNRFPIIVPCHRVINADGSIGQFGAPGGSQTKRRMLELEQRAGRGSSRPAGAGRFSLSAR